MSFLGIYSLYELDLGGVCMGLGFLRLGVGGSSCELTVLWCLVEFWVVLLLGHRPRF